MKRHQRDHIFQMENIRAGLISVTADPSEPNRGGSRTRSLPLHSRNVKAVDAQGLLVYRACPCYGCSDPSPLQASPQALTSGKEVTAPKGSGARVVVQLD